MGCRSHAGHGQAAGRLRQAATLTVTGREGIAWAGFCEVASLSPLNSLRLGNCGLHHTSKSTCTSMSIVSIMLRPRTGAIT